MIDIVIPLYKQLDFLRPALESIEDQDFTDYKVFVVVDGKDTLENKAELTRLKREFKFKLTILPTNKGASVARNIGAKQGKNPFLLFLDADCVLFPGMLRECVETLQEAPEEVAFVYGDYRFEYSKDFYSRPFNKQALETMNYICTMSPVKRTVFEEVGGFPEDMKFFQDWALFYLIVKKGYIGQYIPEFIFSTALPTEDNISGSQGLTLAEKSAIFRKKVGLEDRDLVVTTFGAPLQAEHRADFLEADYAGPSSSGQYAVSPVHLGFDNWKATYTVGMYNYPIEALHNHLLSTVGRPIFHLIGTDVYQLLADQSTLGIQEIYRQLKKQDAVLLVNSKKLKKEMDLLRMDSQLVYTPMDLSLFVNLEKTHKEEEFTVAVYYSDNRNLNFFDVANPTDDNSGRSNISFVYEVAKSMPTVKFKFFGGSHIETVENIEFCGKIPFSEMPKFISGCSMILRSTIHDGLPQLPIQFLVAGKQALVSYTESDLKGAERLSFEHIFDFQASKEETIKKIYEMKTAFKENDGKDNSSLVEYYTTLLDIEEYKKKVYRHIPEEIHND